ncbi:nuclear transport factor 2 family protein [Pseudaquabacterium rugosum]|uniref:Nuclear transport factor 2 family protein n=1 Tax=Pseudaquabacterium rugosum TaxID=2984194 RepID=A0ABU9BH32_9BURK
MDRARFDDYVARFNAEDATAFDDYLSPDVRVQNGGLHYAGVQGMKDHYGRIWGTFRETLDVQRYVADAHSAAVHLKTHFEALHDAEDTPFGPVRRGECFDYDGIVFYEIDGSGRFSDIKVSYLSFTRTGTDGQQRSLGLAH